MHRIGDYSWDRLRANSWEFPILLTYRARLRRLRPTVSFGPAPRHAGGRIDTTGYRGISSFTTAYTLADDWHSNNYAWVTGGGLEARSRHLRIKPEVRWLHWNGSLFPMVRDALQVLVGIGWRLK